MEASKCQIYSGTHANGRLNMADERSSELQALSTKESFQNSSAVVAESSLVSKDNGNSMRSMQSMEELKRVPKLRRWTSIVVLYFTMVDFMSTYSIVTTSLFPYLQHLTGGLSPTTFLGWVMAGYSLGRFVMSPICGYWSDKRPTKEPLIVCFLVSIVANFAYCYAGALPSGGQYVVLVARIVVGGCAGSAAVVRSYVAAATTEEERAWGLAGSSGSQTLGLLIGPLVSLLFVPLGDQGVSIPAIRFHFNMYTGPVYFNILMDIINIILIVVLFREYKIDFEKLNSGKDKATKKDVDWVAVIVALILFFFIFTTIGLFETIAVPYSMDQFAWTRQQAVLNNSIIGGVNALLMIIYYITIAYISKWVEYRIMIMLGLFMLEVAFLLYIPMSDKYPKLMGDSLSNGTMAVGCRDQQLSWCSSVPQLLLPKFVASMIMMTAGYSTSVLPTFTLYSRMLGPFPQGMMMGVLTAVGSVSRAASPLFVTFLYDVSGPQITFASVMAFHSIGIMTLLIFCYRMVPFKHRRAL